MSKEQGSICTPADTGRCRRRHYRSTKPRRPTNIQEREQEGQKNARQSAQGSIQQRKSRERVIGTHQWAIDSLSGLCRGIIYCPSAPPSCCQHDVTALARLTESDLEPETLGCSQHTHAGSAPSCLHCTKESCLSRLCVGVDGVRPTA